MAKYMEELIRVNDMPLYERDPRVMFGQILECIPNIECWSDESLRELYGGMLGILSDLCSELLETARGPEKAKFNRFITWASRGQKRIPKDREVLLSRFFNVLLQGHGEGTLRGYGFANKFGDPMKGNSEVESRRKPC